eukprot:6959365-Alexandrium_andersonii.AAC.1
MRLQVPQLRGRPAAERKQPACTAGRRVARPPQLLRGRVRHQRGRADATSTNPAVNPARTIGQCVVHPLLPAQSPRGPGSSCRRR